MDKKKEIEKMSPVDAYNKAVDDCAQSADIKCVGDPATMGYQNASPRDIKFFDVDTETILKNKIN
ncbi:MAG: hypothetical protein ACOYMZ_00665 [Minisyncoccia bacterium]